jgi:membrane protein
MHAVNVESENRVLISTVYYRRLQNWLWNTEPGARASRVALQAVRYAAALLRDVAEGQITLRAMSLVYTTLLSLAPLLALAFSLLKALGVNERLEPVLRRLLSPLGDQAQAVAHELIGFIDKMRAGLLGFFGVVMLIYTAVSTIDKIEASFNFLWNIHASPGLAKRFGSYLLVLIVGPAVVFAAVGLTASVRSSQVAMQLAQIEPFGHAILSLGRMLPYLLMIGVLSFLYAYIPNTRVRLKAALIGGVFGGTAWQSASLAFATFAAGANYQAVYSGFAIIILLLLWIYFAWLIILIGCRLAFYVQYPQLLPGVVKPPPPSSRATETLALRLMALVGRRALDGEPPLGFEELRGRLAVPAEYLECAVSGLLRHQVLSEAQPGRKLLPGRDLESYSVAQLWLWSRGDAPEPPAEEEQARQALSVLGELEGRVTDQPSPSFRDWLGGGADRASAGQRSGSA